MVSRVTNLNWRFRGNETVMVNNLPVQILWDVHDWLHSNPGSGPGLFIFKPGALNYVLDSVSDSINCSSHQRNEDGCKYESPLVQGSQSTKEFCHFLYAWRTE